MILSPYVFLPDFHRLKPWSMILFVVRELGRINLFLFNFWWFDLPFTIFRGKISWFKVIQSVIFKLWMMNEWNYMLILRLYVILYSQKLASAYLGCSCFLWRNENRLALEDNVVTCVFELSVDWVDSYEVGCFTC